MSDFIPNAFQTPNAYADQFMHLLTSDEWKVLSYACRRIYGWRENRVLGFDRISLSQFEHGVMKGDTRLDHGTGLSRPTLVKILGVLVSHGFLIIVEENDPHKKEGACYALQTNPAKINLAELERRAQEKKEGHRERTTNARMSPNRVPSHTHTEPLPLSDTEVNAVNQSEESNVVNGANQLRLMPLTSTGKSDLPELVNATDREPVNAINRHKLNRNQEEIKTNTHSPPTPSLAPQDSNGNARGVGVSSRFSLEELRVYARNQTPKLGEGWIGKALETGYRDVQVADWYARQKQPAVQSERDTSACPDCHGKGLWYPAGDTPEGRAKGLDKCKHPRLEEYLNRQQQDEARQELAREQSAET